MIQYKKNENIDWRSLKLKYFLNIQKGKVPAKFSSEAISLPYLSMEFLRKKSNPFYVFPQDNLVEVKHGQLSVAVRSYNKHSHGAKRRFKAHSNRYERRNK